MKQKIKLSKWAKLNGYTYRGAHNLFKKGLIPGAFKNESGTILVEDEVDEAQYKDAESLVSTVLSFCASLFGNTLSEKKLKKILKELKK